MRALASSVVAILFGSAFVVTACVGEDLVSGGPTPESEAGANNDGGGGADADVTKGPRGKAAALSFRDGDIRQGFLLGDVAVKKAEDEADVVEYRVYFGKSESAKLVGSPIGTSPAKGVDVTIAIAKDTVMPPGATHLLVYTSNADGENPTPTAVALEDNFLKESTLTLTGISGLQRPSIALDEKNGRIVIAGAEEGTGKLTLALCDKQLGTCTGRDASLGAANNAAIDPTLLVDSVNDRLVVVRQDLSGGGQGILSYTSCSLDGTSCGAKAINAGATNLYGPHAVLDPGKLLYAAVTNGAASGKLGLLRCGLDGNGCVFKDIGTATGAANFTGGNPTVMIDPANQKVVITTNDSSVYLLHLWRCDLQGDNCVRTDAHAGQPNSSCDFPRSTFDATTGQVLTVTRNTIDPVNKQASLFRCDAKTAVCAHANVTAGQQKVPAAKPSVGVFGGTLFFLTRPETVAQPWLFRCKVDGTGCAKYDLSPTTNGFGDQHSLVVDPKTGRVYAAAYNSTTKKTHLFTFTAW
jgi:hypothetical protein